MKMAKQHNFLKLYLQLFGCVAIPATFGWWIDRLETQRMTKYRDKSALYGRELKPGERPSWP